MFSFMCTCVSVSGYVDVNVGTYRGLRVGIIGSCELPDVLLGTELRSSA